MNGIKIAGAALLIASGALVYMDWESAWFPSVELFLAISAAAAVAFFALWYFRLPLLVEARCDDEKLVVVSRAGVERTVLLDDVAVVDSFSMRRKSLQDSDPWFEYGIVTIRQTGKPDEILQFRLTPSGGNLGTHPAVAKLTKRVRRRQDDAGE